VLVGQGARRTVLACSAAARSAGVRRGQRVRDAQRLCPELRVHQRDEAAEEQSFEPVIQAVEDLVAGVEVLRPGLIALAARGPARYHGGEARLAALVREAVADAGAAADGDPLGCGVGVADGVFAAGLAARRPVDEPLLVPVGGSAAFLAPYPLRVLERPELAGLLDRLGVRTLGAFAALPAADVANRFGPLGVRAHRLAGGLDPRPPAARRPGEDLSSLYVFDRGKRRAGGLRRQGVGRPLARRPRRGRGDLRDRADRARHGERAQLRARLAERGRAGRHAVRAGPGAAGALAAGGLAHPRRGG
jgi:protein ImuB